jgi:hypothetical protein
MSAKHTFDSYLLALRRTPLDDKTEHTDRPALQALLQAIADDFTTGLTVHHETKQTRITSKANEGESRVPKKGAPDFKITKAGALILTRLRLRPPRCMAKGEVTAIG